MYQGKLSLKGLCGKRLKINNEKKKLNSLPKIKANKTSKVMFWRYINVTSLCLFLVFTLLILLIIVGGRDPNQRNEAHRSSMKKGKGPIKRQSKPDTWVEFEEARLEYNASSG